METKAEHKPEFDENAQVKLQSSDGQVFTVSRDVIRFSGLIEGMYKNLAIDKAPEKTKTPIILNNVDKITLEKVLEWCEHHKTDINPPENKSDEYQVLKEIPKTAWDKNFFDDFLKGDDAKLLFDVADAANYMDIPPLINHCFEAVAHALKSMNPGDSRKVFKIKSNFNEAGIFKKL